MRPETNSESSAWARRRVGEGTEERVAALVEAGVDLLVVDTAHGHSKGVLDRVQWVKRNFSDVEVVGGTLPRPRRPRPSWTMGQTP